MVDSAMIDVAELTVLESTAEELSTSGKKR